MLIDSYTFYYNITKLNDKVWQPELLERRAVLYIVATFSVNFLSDQCWIDFFVFYPPLKYI